MLHKNKAKQQIPNTWPSFIQGVATARWMHPDGKHRVYLIARSDGLFSHSGEYFTDDPNEMCWTPDNVHAGLYDSEQIAVREILAIYP
jgi:peptide methionine sulfoxide reductase MsrB